MDISKTQNVSVVQSAVDLGSLSKEPDIASAKGVVDKVLASNYSHLFKKCVREKL